MAGVLRLAALALGSLAFTSSTPVIGDTDVATTILAPENFENIDARTAESAGTSDSPFLSCNNLCYGVTRSRAIEAVNWFCNAASGRTFTTSANNYHDNWIYPPDSKPQGSVYYEEGNIRMSINITTGAECSPDVTMTFADCWAGIFHECVDSCNTNGENGKQGGWFVDGCLTYEFQPNPIYWPYCFFGPDQPGSHRRGVLEAGDVTPRNVSSQVLSVHTTTMTQSLSAGAMAAMFTEPPRGSADCGKTSMKNECGQPVCFNDCHGDAKYTSPTNAALPALPELGAQDMIIPTTSISPRSKPSSFATLSSEDDWGPPFCLNTCYGVTRLVAGKASDAFARAMGDHDFTTLADDAWLHWYYDPADHYFQGPGWVEEGHVQMTINVIPGVTCDPTVHLYNHLTYEILMHGIIDKCNTHSTQGKQGGWLVMGCLNFTINPNPDYWPTCKFDHSMDRNQSAGLDTNGTLKSATVAQFSLGKVQ